MADLLAPFAGDRAGELAERLIGRFGTLQRVLAAPLPQLRAAAAGHDAAIEAIAGARALVDAALDEELAGAPVDGQDPALHRYLCRQIGAAHDERLHVVWCDARRGYLGCAEIASGTASRIEAHARPLFERALAIGAGGFLLAHNHPSGACRPSAEDVSATRRLAALAEALDLELVDHLVVTRRRVFSMRAGGCF